MKFFLNRPIKTIGLLENKFFESDSTEFHSDEYGKALFAQIGLQGINNDDIEETIIEYGFIKGNKSGGFEFNFVKADEVTDLKLCFGENKKSILDAKSIDSVNFLIDYWKSITDDEKNFLEVQKRFSVMLELGYEAGCFSNNEKTDKFLNGLFVESIDENGVAIVGFKGEENIREKKNLFSLNEKFGWGDEFNKLLATCNELGYGNGKEFMVLDRNAYNVSCADSGEFVDSAVGNGSCMFLGIKDESYFLPTNFNLYELKKEYAYGVFDGRVSFYDVQDLIDEDLMHSVQKYGETEADEILIESLDEELEILWNQDYEDYATIHAQINELLKENGLEDKITILSRKGKEFMIFPAFKESEGFYSDDEDCPLSITEKATPDEINKVMEGLKRIKEGMLLNASEVARERLMERLVECSNEYCEDDDNTRRM